MRLTFFLGVLATAFGLAMGCGASTDEPRGSETDGGGQQDAAGEDAATESADDAGADPDARADAGGAGEGAECFFNSECQSALRCECDESTGCSCQPGTRGTGAPGASCTSGNDCASSVCINEATCSGPCKTDKDCPAELPQCLFIFGSPQKVCSPAE